MEKEKIDVSFENFKEKVKFDLVGFDTSEEGRELADEKDGLIHFAIGKAEKEASYEFCKTNKILEFVIQGMQVEMGLARNCKLLLNVKDEEIKELWI